MSAKVTESSEAEKMMSQHVQEMQTEVVEIKTGLTRYYALSFNHIQSYKHFMSVNFDPRVIIWAILKSVRP